MNQLDEADRELQEGQVAEENEGSDGTESRQSRKREREASVEPGTPQATAIDIDSGHPEPKDPRVPTKKNRLNGTLDATQEEEEGGENVSAVAPGISGSPPDETKMRQISQGVEDITWKNMAKHPTPDPDRPQVDDQQNAMETGHEEETKDEEVEPVEVPPLMRSENPPMLGEDAGVDEETGAAHPAEAPPDAPDASPSAIEVKEHTELPSTPPPRSPSPIITSPLPDVSKVSRRGSDSSIEEKGLKRKLGDRTVSDMKVPDDRLGENGFTTHTTASKRPRDDPDKDDNPRLTKRPTPPPEEEESTDRSTQPSSQVKGQTSAPASSATPKLSGFMAYASTSSPFASVKGPSMFSPNKPSTWASSSTSPFASGPSTPAPSSKLSLNNSPFFSSSTSKARAESTLKRTGFEAFASVTSPFGSAAKRPKSPPPATPSAFGHRSKSPARHHSPARAAAGINPFSAYATGGVHAFAKSSVKRSSGSPALAENGAEAGSSVLASQGSGEDEESSREESGSEKGVSFGDRLRAEKDEEEEVDEEKKLKLTEQEVQTGEEDEETVYQVRGKLFALSDQNQWKERGTGQLKLNVRREDGSGARLLMRKEAVYTVLLNAALFKGMKCSLAQDPRYIRFSLLESGSTTHYNLRVSNAKIAEELLEEINSHIPGE
ncbi:hypothetical protein EW026_g3719 [Hermanssonia centrifuga]|uniref:RanBD1 domain-containing protein n=1 Tax=Hermanssonia centrifuga TaxID=98765 RepID=A0A4V3XAK4_9APHY|nr:hypothetical protein EW026_g3719 [Hermanssonia centrifuga]